MTLHTLNGGQTVFKLGDYGNKFYVMINGTVSIHVKMMKESSKDDPSGAQNEDTHQK